MAQSMTATDRHQRILDILRQRSSAKVSELSDTLGVSQVTVRSDLDVLEGQGHISRLRGGAMLKNGYQIQDPALAARAQTNEATKRRIARRAADMVEDGAVILLDDSTTAFYMIPHLQQRQNLTVVTSGIEAGLALSRNPAHTVILLGGVMHAGGTSVVGPLSEGTLKELHFGTAFLSCTGFSCEAGMTQADMQKGQIQRQMVASADRVVALVDGSKFGKAILLPFAKIDQIDHVLTDSSVQEAYVDQLRRLGVRVTVCGVNTVSSFVPIGDEDRHYQIGFANLGEDQGIFAVDVRHGLEQAAQRIGNVDLVMADNRLDGEVALKMADRLVAKGVDLAIEYQIHEHVGSLVASKFHEAQIPVIAIDIPMVGATYFGVDNYRAGHMAGVALGEWIVAQWQGRVDHVLILRYPLAATLPAARLRGQIEGLQQVLGILPPAKITHVDGGNTAELCQLATAKAMEPLSQESRIAILPFNDNATMGALDAIRSQGRERLAVIVGLGADRQVRDQIRRADSPIIGATAFWPERYGEKLMALAAEILQGAPTPPAVYIDHVFLDQGNISRFYPDEASSNQEFPKKGEGSRGP